MRHMPYFCSRDSPNTMAKIFISSTYEDLKDHRKAVDDILRRMQETSVIMEFFGARSQEPVVACIEEVKACSFFIGIYAHRYGYIPEDSDISITEMELNCAEAQGLKILCYRVDENHPWPPPFIEDGAKKHKLQQLKKRISEKYVRGTFTTPEDLASKVTADLARELKNNTPAEEEVVWKQKHLAAAPPPPPVYMGDSRKTTLQTIRQRTAGPCKTVVLCAEGGAGKSSILAKYCEQYGAEYPRIVWLTCGPGQSVAEVFAGDPKLVDTLRPAMPRWRDEWETAQKFDCLLETLAAEERTGLLVLDNVNEEAQLDQYQDAFEAKLRRWTCLIGTRHSKLRYTHTLKVEPLDPDFAYQLFVLHWLGEGQQPSEDDAERLRSLLERIRYHALLIEVMAKYLRTCREEGLGDGLPDLLRTLSEEGLLGLPKTDKVRVSWHGAVGTPLQILEKLFDMSQLKPELETLLLQTSLLPAVYLPMAQLLHIFGIDRQQDSQQYEAFKADLEHLAAAGWLEFLPQQGYRAHPIIAELVRQRLLPDFERCQKVLSALSRLLDTWKISDAKPFLPIAEAVLENLGRHTKHMSTSDLACALGDGYMALGNLPKAEQYFRGYYDIAQTLAAAAPEEADIQRDYAVANSKMGDILLQLGKPHDALPFFEQYLQISQTLALHNPHAENIQREYAIANGKMGNILLALGKPHDALPFFEQALQIFQTLAQHNPHAENIQRSYAVANSRMGDILLALGKPHDALPFFEQSLQTIQTLALHLPRSENIQRDYAVANSKMGDILLQLGKPHDALPFFEQDLQISQTLALHNPHAENIQRDYAIANGKMGDILLQLGKPHDALPFFEQDLQISQTLALHNPHAENIQRDYAGALVRVGIAELSAGGDASHARSQMEQALAILEKCLERNPLSAQIREDAEALRQLLAAF